MISDEFRGSRPTLWVGCFLSLIALQGCGNNQACSTQGDCFQGEVCVSGACEVANGSTNAGTNNATANNAASNNVAANNVAANNVANTNSNTSTSNSECLVDLIGNTCAEDDWEENDGYDPATASWDVTPWASNSWCVGTEIPEPRRTLSGTLCAGDRGDAFRLVVANNGPVCITGDFVTFRILVELKTPCDGDLIRVEPYTFGRDPIRNDLCADDPNVRCTVSNQGMTHLIEWLFPREQILDPRVQIMSGAQNLQVDYDLTFEVLPQ